MKPNAKLTETAAEFIASIDDLLMQIFQFLPTRPLVRFESVCKHWRSLIGTERLRRRRQPNPPAVGLIFELLNLTDHNPSRRVYAYIVPFDKASSSTDPPHRQLEFPDREPSPPHWNIMILSACNGLLVCGVDESFNSLYERGYYIVNPTTNKYSKLPKPEGKSSTWRIIDSMCLAFDPSVSLHYKLVCVRLFTQTNLCKFEVYSSQTGSWETRIKPFTSPEVEYGSGVYWNGAIHWINYTVAGESIYFNPDDHQMPHVMPTPPPMVDNSFGGRGYYFGESCDHLHCIYGDGDDKAYEFTVYEMKRDYSEWFVKYRVARLPNVVSIWPWFSICSLVRGQKDEDTFLVYRNRGTIVRYNLVHKTHETIHEMRKDLRTQNIHFSRLSPFALFSFC